jgi:hypothetical protein
VNPLRTHGDLPLPFPPHIPESARIRTRNTRHPLIMIAQLLPSTLHAAACKSQAARTPHVADAAIPPGNKARETAFTELLLLDGGHKARAIAVVAFLFAPPHTSRQVRGAGWSLRSMQATVL